MESNSKSNRILCSEKAYKLLREQAPDILCHKRGKIQVKGRGDMMTYWVGDKLIKAKRDHREEGKTIMFADYVQPLSSPLGLVKPSIVVQSTTSMGGGGATVTTAATSSSTTSRIASRFDFTGSIIPSKDRIVDDPLVPPPLQEQAPKQPRPEHAPQRPVTSIQAYSTMSEGERLMMVM